MFDINTYRAISSQRKTVRIKKVLNQAASNSARQMFSEAMEMRLLFSAVPVPFTSVDVGQVGIAGSATYAASTGTFTVNGAGTDIFGAADAFQFVYQPLDGDGSITVHETGNFSADPLAHAGITIRSSLSPTAANAFLADQEGGPVFANSRTTDGGNGTNLTVQSAALPNWLQLQRSGDTITALTSTDGTNFTVIATTTLPNLPNHALVGMVVASNNPSQISTGTFDKVTVTDSVPPTAQINSAPPVTSLTSTPYQFSVDFSDNVAIDASTIAGTNVLVTGPGGYSQTGTLVSTGLANGTPVTATYSVPSPPSPGTYTISLVSNQVKDISGNPVAGGPLGTFVANFSTDTTPPTGVVSNAPTDTSSTTPYTFSMTWSDDVAVKASSIGSGNVLVTGPGGYSQLGTLVSAATGDSNTIVAQYRVTAPAVDGTYTVSVGSNPVTDTNNNPIAAATLGTFTVAINQPTGSISGYVLGIKGLGLPGQTVYLDSNKNGVLDSGEPTSITDSTGFYSFANLLTGTYRVEEVPTSGLFEGEPDSGFRDVMVTSGATTGSVRFANFRNPLAAGTAGPDLVVAYTGAPPVSGIEGNKGSFSVKITNVGTTTATGPVDLSLMASTNGTISGTASYIGTVSASKSINLKPNASKTVKFAFEYPTLVTAGSYSLVTTVDSSNGIVETNESNNLAASAPITISSSTIDLTGAFTKTPTSIVRGKSASVTVQLNNIGTSPASGQMSISIYQSPTPTFSSSDLLIGTLPHANISLKPGANHKYTFSFKAPTTAATGSEYLIAFVNSAVTIGESDLTNNTAASASTVSFS